MGTKPWLHPAPQYKTLETFWDDEEDAPGPRCAHTLTAVAATKTHGPRLILFGGATAIEGGSSSLPGIRLAGVTNSVHSYDVLTRKWTRLKPAGEPPSPRAAHAAAAVGTMVVFQGGIGPAGHSTDDLYVLDMTNDKFKWHRVVVQGEGPGPRYGHVMDLVSQRYLVTVTGNDGKRALSDAWALDTAQKPYVWQRLNPDGDRPSARMYATGSARSDGMFLLCGGRDTLGAPLGDAYGLLMHRNGQWEWTLAPGVAPSPRYQHAAVFVGARLHVSGGVLRGGRVIDAEVTVAVLDTAAGVWLDRNGQVTSARGSKGQIDQDPSVELMRRCRHGAASVGIRIYVHGGLRGDVLLDDFLVAENSTFQSDISSPLSASDRTQQSSTPRFSYAARPPSGSEPALSMSEGLSLDEDSLEKLTEASAAEAEAASSVWRAAQLGSASIDEEPSTSDGSSSTVEPTTYGPETEGDVRLHPRAVVVAKETVGSLGGMVRQLSLDQFQNESRRMVPMNNSDVPQPTKKYTRQKSPQGLHKKVISALLRPRNWKPPGNRKFFLDSYEVGGLSFRSIKTFHSPQEPHHTLTTMSILLPTNLQQCPSPSLSPSSPLFPPSPSTAFPVVGTHRRCLRLVTSCVSTVQSSVANGYAPSVVVERDQIRLGLPSKGRMAADSIDLLKDCQLFVKQVNPRQYVAQIPQLPNTEVWFQRPKDIVRKLLSGDLDLGIVGLDTLSEYGQENGDLIIVHEALNFGDCHLSIAIPNYGIFENVNSLKELAQMPQWSEERPLRVATGFTYLGPKFMKENGIKHVTFSTADGALEAAPAMGIADAILDLVSSGTTLKENNLKEIEGGVVLESQAALVASRRALTERKGALNTVHEILERLEAHLKADGQFTVVANMRGNSAEEVAERVLSQPSLSGLQGPTISPVYCTQDGKVSIDYYAIVICVPKKALYDSVKQLRAVGGSGVLVSPLTYIFDEETPRWGQLLRNLKL